jgi:hypothetical protein
MAVLVTGALRRRHVARIARARRRALTKAFRALSPDTATITAFDGASAAFLGASLLVEFATLCLMNFAMVWFEKKARPTVPTGGPSSRAEQGERAGMSLIYRFYR